MKRRKVLSVKRSNGEIRYALECGHVSRVDDKANVSPMGHVTKPKTFICHQCSA